MAEKSNAARRSAEKAVKKAVKKSHKGTLIAVVLALLVGLAGGAVFCAVLSKNDGFELVGEKEITLSVGQTFTDEGCRVVAMGKDVSDSVTVQIMFHAMDGSRAETDAVDTSRAGTYFLIYRAESKKYGKDYKRVRTVNVVEAEDVGQ